MLNRSHFTRFEKLTLLENDNFWDPFRPFWPFSITTLFEKCSFHTMLNRSKSIGLENLTILENRKFWDPFRPFWIEIFFEKCSFHAILNRFHFTRLEKSTTLENAIFWDPFRPFWLFSMKIFKKFYHFTPCSIDPISLDSTKLSVLENRKCWDPVRPVGSFLVTTYFENCSFHTLLNRCESIGFEKLTILENAKFCNPISPFRPFWIDLLIHFQIGTSPIPLNRITGKLTVKWTSISFCMNPQWFVTSGGTGSNQSPSFTIQKQTKSPSSLKQTKKKLNHRKNNWKKKEKKKLSMIGHWFEHFDRTIFSFDPIIGPYLSDGGSKQSDLNLAQSTIWRLERPQVIINP